MELTNQLKILTEVHIGTVTGGLQHILFTPVINKSSVDFN